MMYLHETTQLLMGKTDAFVDLFERVYQPLMEQIGVRLVAQWETVPDMFMWGSDYPHNDSTYPDSQQVVERVFGGVDAATRRQILSGNAAKLYGIRHPTLAS